MYNKNIATNFVYTCIKNIIISTTNTIFFSKLLSKSVDRFIEMIWQIHIFETKPAYFLYKNIYSFRLIIIILFIIQLKLIKVGWGK